MNNNSAEQRRITLSDQMTEDEKKIALRDSVLEGFNVVVAVSIMAARRLEELESHEMIIVTLEKSDQLHQPGNESLSEERVLEAIQQNRETKQKALQDLQENFRQSIENYIINLRNGDVTDIEINDLLKLIPKEVQRMIDKSL